MSLSSKLGVCLLIGVFVVMSFQGVKAEIVVEKPSPSVGDYWQYSYATTTMNGNEKYTITGIQDLSQAGDMYNVYVMTVTGSGTYDDTYYQGTYTFSGTTYIGTSDFSRVKIVFTYDITIPSGTISHMVQQCTFVYLPPVKEYDFPLKAGKTWSVSSTEQENCQITVDNVPQTPVVQNNQVSYSMSSPSSGAKSVTAGTFDAVYLKSSETTPTEQWVSADTGFLLMEQVGTSYKLELISYHYSKPIVQGLSSMMLYAIIAVVVIVVVVVVLVVVMLMMKKKKAAAGAAVLPPQYAAAPVAPAPVAQAPAYSPPPAAYPLPPQQAPPAQPQAQPPAPAPQPQYAPPPVAAPAPAYSPPPAPRPVAPPPAPAPPPPAPAPTALCPTCRSQLRIISEYNKWYCDTCRRYP